MDGSAPEDGFPGKRLFVLYTSCVLMRLTSAQEIMMFLQALPTKDWTEKDIELLLSEAFIWQSLFQDSRAHLRAAGEPPENGIFY